MSHNKQLAQKLGLTEDQTKAIDLLHEMAEQIKEDPLLHCSSLKESEEVLHGVHYCLQWLWGFGLDKSLHWDVYQFKFKNQWAGRKFKCVHSGEVFTVPESPRETDFFSWGDGAYLDLGRLGGYHRMSCCEEITEENIVD